MKRKKTFLFVIILFFIFFLVTTAFLLKKESKIENLSNSFSIESSIYSKLKIQPWFSKEENIIYVFLPSFIDLSTASLNFQASGIWKLDEVEIQTQHTLSNIDFNKVYSLTLTTLFKKITNQVKFIKSENVATLFLDITDSSLQEVERDKMHKEPTRMTLFSAEGAVNYESFNSDYIRGRGNSTWDFEKKPFNIYLTSPASLLGLTNSSKYILLANSYDETNLRNKIIFDLSKQLGVDWSPNYSYVDVYINGYYNGLYLLSEPIVTNYDPQIRSIIEITTKAGLKENNFQTQSGRYIDVEEPQSISTKEKELLISRVNKLENAILNKDFEALQSIIDIDSLAKKFLIDEVFINADSDNRSSFYYWREDQNKFFAGPIWDYDLSLGNTYGVWTHFSKDPNQIFAKRTEWYNSLLSVEEFMEYVKTIYSDLFLPLLDKIVQNDLTQHSAEISNATQMNSIRWEKMFSELRSNNIQDTGVDSINKFLAERTSFLDSIWLKEEPYSIVTVRDTASNFYKYLFVKQGELLDTTTLPSAIDYQVESISNWVNSETGEDIDFSLPITKDVDICPIFHINDSPIQKIMKHKLTIKILLAVGTLGLLFLILFIADIKTNHIKTKKREG